VGNQEVTDCHKDKPLAIPTLVGILIGSNVRDCKEICGNCIDL